MNIKSKKFWKKISLKKEKSLGIILLDNNELLSPEGNKLNLPFVLSKKVFNEWQNVKQDIVPSSMPFYSYAVTAIDRVLNKFEGVYNNLENILNMDLVLYRAGNDKELLKIQEKEWHPIVRWAENKFNCTFAINYDLNPINQNKDELKKCVEFIRKLDHFSLSGLSHLISISGSFILSVNFYFENIKPQKLYELAFLEELYQLQKWGDDELSIERRNNIKKEIFEASKYISILPKVVK